MGIFNNTVSLCQFQVLGAQPDQLASWVSERLAWQAFRSIEENADELSIGWVRIDDHELSDFSGPHTFQYDHYIAFTLRHDQRKLPGGLLKAHLHRAEQEFLAANPGLRKVPKQKRENLRDAVRGMLLGKTLPVPATYDVVWDSRSQLLSFTALSAKVIELFVELFKKSFPELRLVPVHPYSRAELLLQGGPLEAVLAQANRAGSEAVLDLIEANQWLGRDFLLWLVNDTLHGSAEFAVNRPGPAVNGETFVAYINDRLQLLARSETGVQRVTVSGPQRDFNEVRTALGDGKEILEAVLYLEKQEQSWKMTVKGDLFQFASFKSPPVTIEKDDLTDPVMEKQAVFFERMYLLEGGLQLFDSLYAQFLAQRLASDWPATEQAILNQLAFGGNRE